MPLLLLLLMLMHPPLLLLLLLLLLLQLLLLLHLPLLLRMICESEYYEWAATTPAGNLSRSEAQANWKKWMADPKWPHDEDGPRGFVRLFVKTRTVVSQFQEVSKDKVLRREEKLGKKATAEDLLNRLRLVVGDEGMDQHEVGNWNRLMEDTHRSFSSGGNALGDSTIMAPDIEDLLNGVQSKKRKVSNKQDEAGDDNSDEPSAEDDSEAATPAAKSKGGQQKPPGEPADTPTKALAEEKVLKAEQYYMRGSKLLRTL